MPHDTLARSVLVKKGKRKKSIRGSVQSVLDIVFGFRRHGRNKVVGMCINSNNRTSNTPLKPYCKGMRPPHLITLH